jgi:hypothetical protein
LKNFCLDCSQCVAVEPAEEQPPPGPKLRPHRGGRLPARLSLPG